MSVSYYQFLLFIIMFNAESVIQTAIARLEDEAEIACTKDLVCLPI